MIAEYPVEAEGAISFWVSSANGCADQTQHFESLKHHFTSFLGLCCKWGIKSFIVKILLRVLFVLCVGLGAIIIINRLCFYKYPPDIDGAVTLCVYSSLFLHVCVLANFLHCNKSPTKAPFSAISNEAIYTQQFVPQSFSSVTTDILSDWLNVVNQLKETWGQFGIIKGKSKCNFWRKKTLPKAQRPRGLSGSYTNVDQISSSEPQPSVNYVQNLNQTSATHWKWLSLQQTKSIDKQAYWY